MCENFSKSPKRSSPRQKMIDSVRNLCIQNSLEFDTFLIEDLPKKWTIFEDLAVLPRKCLSKVEWNNLGKNILSFIN